MQVNVEDVAELKKFLPIEESFSPPYGRLVCLQVRTIAKERQRENAELVQHSVYNNTCTVICRHRAGHVKILPATRPASLGEWENRFLLSKTASVSRICSYSVQCCGRIRNWPFWQENLYKFVKFFLFGKIRLRIRAYIFSFEKFKILKSLAGPYS